jgi:hypothetical protein
MYSSCSWPLGLHNPVYQIAALEVMSFDLEQISVAVGAGVVADIVPRFIASAHLADIGLIFQWLIIFTVPTASTPGTADQLIDDRLRVHGDSYVWGSQGPKKESDNRWPHGDDTFVGSFATTPALRVPEINLFG